MPSILSNSFDLVISRVSLPYTDIPQSLSEIARVLREDGRVWLSLHPFSKTVKHLMSALSQFRIKASFSIST